MLRALRSSLFALFAAGLIAIFLKAQGGSHTPPQQGGWRELSGPELR